MKTISKHGPQGCESNEKYYSFQQMIQTSPRYLLELTMVGFLVYLLSV